MVAATTVERHGPARSSAARRKIAARSSHGVRAHAGDSSPHAARRGSSPLLGWASVKVSEISYDVDGWGRGTLWFDDAVLVWHELPSPHPDASSSGAPQPTTHCDSIVEI